MLEIAVGKAFLPVGKWLIGKIAEKGFNNISSKLQEDVLTKKFEQHVDNASKLLQDKYPTALGGSMDIFFREEEIFNELFKLLFKNSKVDLNVIKKNLDLKTLPENFVEEFINNLKNSLLTDIEFNEILSNNELYLSFIGLEKNMESITENSSLTVDELSKIRKLLEEKYLDNFNYSSFLENYKKSAVHNLSQVNFFGLGIQPHITKTRKKLQDIYVKPNFSEDTGRPTIDSQLSINKSSRIKAMQKKVKFNDLFNDGNNFVILGNPGSGKSVLIKYLMCSILEHHSSEFNNQEIFEFLPLRVELKSYLAYKRDEHYNLPKYLKVTLEKDYGISNISENSIENILNERKTIVFFDGLDEIFDIQDKSDIKNDVENFSKKYNKSKSIVTSRIIGYEDAKLEETFKELVILDFDNDQIIEYVEKWYSLEETNITVKNQEIAEFLRLKTSMDDELIENPLLLSLIVILYRYNGKIPSSKLEIYRSCTKTLVDKWDESKKLSIDISDNLKKHKENIFVNLAFWQYEKSSNQDGSSSNLNYIQVYNKVSEIIAKLHLTQSDIEASNWSESFLDYAAKRSIYFDNNFTHKTFLEYYTSLYIYKYYSLKGKYIELNDLIAKYITNPFWSIVIELLVNMIDENQGDSEIIDELILNQINISSNSLPFILRIIPSIKNISENTIEKVMTSAILFCINEIIYDIKSKSWDENNKYIYDAFSQMAKLTSNDRLLNRMQISFDKCYSIVSEDTELLIRYHIFYKELTSSMRRTSTTNKLTNNHTDDIDELYAKSPYIYRLYKVNTKSYWDTTIEYIELFGNNNFSQDFKFYFQSFSIYSSLYDYYMRNQIQLGNINSLLNNLKILLSKNIDIELLSYNRFLSSIQHSKTNTLVIIQRLIDILNDVDDNVILIFVLKMINLLFRNKDDIIYSNKKDDVINHSMSIQLDVDKIVNEDIRKIVELILTNKMDMDSIKDLRIL